MIETRVCDFSALLNVMLKVTQIQSVTHGTFTRIHSIRLHCGGAAR
jgi:hypothetical protein